VTIETKTTTRQKGETQKSFATLRRGRQQETRTRTRTTTRTRTKGDVEWHKLRFRLNMLYTKPIHTPTHTYTHTNLHTSNNTEIYKCRHTAHSELWAQENRVNSSNQLNSYLINSIFRIIKFIYIYIYKKLDWN